MTEVRLLCKENVSVGVGGFGEVDGRLRGEGKGETMNGKAEEGTIE
jgi:hypothetical protein